MIKLLLFAAGTLLLCFIAGLIMGLTEVLIEHRGERRALRQLGNANKAIRSFTDET